MIAATRTSSTEEPVHTITPTKSKQDSLSSDNPQNVPADGTKPAPEDNVEKTEDFNSNDAEYPTGLRLSLILTSAFLSVFLVALDRLIIATPIPAITDEFNSVADIGWYGSSFMITTCACQLLYGKLYTNFSIKTIFLVAVVLFEIGSAICGAAPSSVVLIIGRAIAGVGGAGISTGVITIMVLTIPLKKRPMYQGLFGAIFGIASVLGPLVGGVFTTEVTWRWCFYINLPFGVVSVVLIIFLLKLSKQDSRKLPIRQRLAQLDFYGTALVVPGSVCLILAMEWGGLKYAWDDGRVIALLVLASVLLVAFVAVQILLPKTATIPPRIFLQRSMISGAFYCFCSGAQLMLITFYLSVWFQAIQGYPAIDSGIQSLSMLIPMVAASVISGLVIRRIGYYTPVMIAGTCLTCIGAGLIWTFDVHTKQANWVGYLIVYGFGLGSCLQAPNLAAQTVLPKRDVPIGTSLMLFTQLLGGAIFVAVGQNIMTQELANNLAHIPGFSTSEIQHAGATSMVDLPSSIKPIVLDGYSKALQRIFLVGLIMNCLSLLGALAMEWKSTRHGEQEAEQELDDAKAV